MFTCPFQTKFSDAIENCDGRDCETVVLCRCIPVHIGFGWRGVGGKEDRLGIGWARGESDPKVQPGCLAPEEEGRKAVLSRRERL